MPSIDEESLRAGVAAAERVVVKVGSSSLTSLSGGLDADRLTALVDAVAARVGAGRQVVVVSSGAIAAGLAPLGLPRRPRDLSTQQAAASVGQLVLTERYAAAFARHQLTVGQVLLTADDLVRRNHYRNALRTLDRLLGLGVVPVVNENDAVATDEIRFGDNDRLAALVAHLVDAAALVLLSDVAALYTDRPGRSGARRIDLVRSTADLADVEVRRGGGGLGSGGMASKLEAASVATGEGIAVLLAPADRAAAALATDPAEVCGVGTVFAPTAPRSKSRLFWLRHATTPRGWLTLDDGAIRAVVGRRASLLPAGVQAVTGDFSAGDPVELRAVDGTAVARGLIAYDAGEIPALLGRRTGELDPDYRRELVHRDDIVLL